MIVYEGLGDVFACNSQTITCPVNSVGAMGKGLAYEFKIRVPGLEAFYRREYPYGNRYNLTQAEVDYYKLRTFVVPDGRQVLLFPTKRHWKEKSNVQQIDANLATLARDYRLLNIQSLGLSALGCGEGSLYYQRDVRPLIHKHFGDHSLPVEILLTA